MKKIFLVILLALPFNQIFSQDKVIDQVVAIVGSKMIKLSDIENQYAQYVMQGYIKADTTFKCQLIEELLFQKLLLNQADIDSITVTDTQVETDLDRRLNYFAKQMGGFDALEKYYNKTTLEIKADFREIIKNQLLQQQVEAKITDNVKVTPSEVKSFFNNLPVDSIPTISSEVEIGQIIKMPAISDAEKNKAKEKLNGIRDRILKGEDFSTLAIMYSEDDGTAAKGGELGFTSRGELDPTFEAAAFKLKEGEISPVVQSKFGYHIIKLIERRGEMINVKHILIIPKVATEDLLKAKLSLDTIYTKIKSDSITFEAAAKKYSDDPSKNNSGIMVNTETGTSKFEPDQLDVSLFYVIDKLKPGEMSLPVPMKTDEGKQAYRILYLKTRTEPHRANMKEDYDKIQEAALKEKQNEEVKKWIKEKAAITYIHIAKEYLGCDYTYDWFAKPK
ncbi:MAG TPA: peptidylprolyl isomerase [Bacteroidales bacterium]|nr:peptidylprolyl isomerase [Bacteroidales bacterium]HPS15632.1 peptidylprolyl isomerase [Bacteroidales bacterium]